MMRKAIFLDRDGVINRAKVLNGKPYPPSDISELEILPGVSEALCRLHDAGFYLIVVTNQPDVARGKQTREAVESIHQILQAKLPLDKISVCFHDDDDQCSCRKPSPGMLIDAAREFELDIASCFMIGDRWRDVEAGERAGCTTIFIDYGYDEAQPERVHAKVKSLLEASEWILSNELKEV